MLSDLWTVVSGGVEKSVADWGISNPSIKTKSLSVGELTFEIEGANADSVPVFADKSAFLLKRGGVGYFAGKVTKIPRRGDPVEQSLSYVVSDPWYDIERTTFQQQWMSCDLTGGAGATMTTTQSRVIVGQSLDGVKMSYGDVMREVLIYMLYAVQALPFPTVVLANHLPAVPDPTAGTPPNFKIGTITPGITGTYYEVTDKKCGEIIKLLMREMPDVVQWFDYSTTPPTLHIDHRANLAGKVIAVKDGTMVSGFHPTALYELQVPVVICKYQQTNTNDGKTFSLLVVDKYPLSGRDNDPDAFVETVDLVGGNAVYQHQDVVVQHLPGDATGTATLPWVKSHIPWLFGTTALPSPYDVANIAVDAFLGKSLDPKDPYVLDPDSAPTGFALRELTKELLGIGAITKWMTDDQGIWGAGVILAFRLKYTGGDPVTAALFQSDPTRPLTAVHYIGVTGTNADTDTYKQLTSLQPSEPVPVGNAQKLYQTLSVLHQKGTLQITEQDCQNRLPVGCVFNTSDGLPEWQAMNALVLSVTELLEVGITTVEFGPTLYLGLEDLVELARANRGRIFSYDLAQRTSGVAGDGNAVIGHHRVATHTTSTPVPQSFVSGPFTVLWRVNPADPTGNTFQAMVVLTSTLLRTSNLFDNIALTGLGAWFNLNADDTIWLVGAVLNYAVTGSPQINSFGNGDTDYVPGSVNPRTGGEVEVDGGTPPKQIWFRKVIAVSIADAHGKPSLTQYVQSDMVMKNTFQFLVPAIYPYPL